MFTGIIQGLGTVIEKRPAGGGMVFCLEANFDLTDPEDDGDDSVAAPDLTGKWEVQSMGADLTIHDRRQFGRAGGGDNADDTSDNIRKDGRRTCQRDRYAGEQKDPGADHHPDATPAQQPTGAGIEQAAGND